MPSVTCTRRAVLIGTIAVGVTAATATTAWHAAAETSDCRQWCLRYADDACRTGQRPGCAPLDDS